MTVHHGIVDAIGNTPLIRLRRASEQTGCEILGKAEFMNPGQSVKDRAALFIIQDAVKRGTLRPGGTVVEGGERAHLHGATLRAAGGHQRLAVPPEEAGGAGEVGQGAHPLADEVTLG